MQLLPELGNLPVAEDGPGASEVAAQVRIGVSQIRPACGGLFDLLEVEKPENLEGVLRHRRTAPVGFLQLCEQTGIASRVGPRSLHRIPEPCQRNLQSGVFGSGIAARKDVVPGLVDITCGLFDQSDPCDLGR